MAGGGDGSGDGGALIFVYGTLKRGFYNHKLLDELIRTGGAAYVGSCATVEAFPLVCGPYGIPYLINLRGEGKIVRGELYSVASADGRARLDELEGVERGHYERLPVAVEGGAAEAYFAHRNFGEKLWRRCGEVGLSEFDEELGKRYVRREDRPIGHNFIDDIYKFISEPNSSPSS